MSSTDATSPSTVTAAMTSRSGPCTRCAAAHANARPRSRASFLGPTASRALTKDPSSLADGIFSIEEKKGLLSRLLSRKRDDDMPDALPISVKPKERSEEERRRLAETKALVEEALGD